jgi:hypothetical protein
MSATAPTLQTPQNIDMNLESPFIKVVQECIVKSKSDIMFIKVNIPCSIQISQEVHWERGE